MLQTMTELPLVYVIVLTWNGKADILECLKSLQNLAYPNTKILVVDNASEDGTAEAIHSLFPGFELICNGSNLRFARGNNVGIDYSLRRGADYVLLLNNDTVADHDFLSHLVETAESDKKIGIVGPKIYYYDKPRRIWFAGGTINWWTGGVAHAGIREEDKGKYDVTTEVDYITGCCMLVKREVIDAVGMLDARYHMYVEDVDWCVRAMRAGYKLVYVPSSKVWHKLSASTKGHLSWFKNWNKLKSRLRLMSLYAHWYQWPTIFIGVFVEAIQGYLHGRANEQT
jgi:GT2 family glycosyltransferase